MDIKRQVVIGSICLVIGVAIGYEWANKQRLQNLTDDIDGNRIDLFCYQLGEQHIDEINQLPVDDGEFELQQRITSAKHFLRRGGVDVD